MKKKHSQDEIERVCRELLEEGGHDALTRSAVQDRLKALAVAEGFSPGGADTAKVAKAIRDVREQQRAAHATSTVTLTAEVLSGAVPEQIASHLISHIEVIERDVTELIHALRAHATMESDVGIRTLTERKALEITRLEGVVTTMERDFADVATELDEVRLALEQSQQTAERAAVTAAARAAEWTALEGQTRKQILALEEDVRQAHAARAEADARAHCAELQLAAQGQQSQKVVP